MKKLLVFILLGSVAFALSNNISLQNTAWVGLPRSGSPPVTTAFVTGVTGGSPQTFTGEVGMQIVVGASNITVTSLGRWVPSGNSGTHTLYLCDASFAIIDSVSVNTSGAPSGAFLYGTLPSSHVLTATGTYYVVSNESGGGDQFLDDSSTVTTTLAATLTFSCYGTAGTLLTTHFANKAYVPVDLKYQ